MLILYFVFVLLFISKISYPLYNERPQRPWRNQSQQHDLVRISSNTRIIIHLRNYYFFIISGTITTNQIHQSWTQHLHIHTLLFSEFV